MATTSTDSKSILTTVPSTSSSIPSMSSSTSSSVSSLIPSKVATTVVIPAPLSAWSVSALSSTSSSSSSSSSSSTAPKPVPMLPALFDYKGISDDDYNTLTAGLGYDAKTLATKRAQLDFIIECNGYDGYSTTEVTLGALPKSQYLQLPDDLKLDLISVDEDQVGDGRITREARLTIKNKADIYAMNKAVAPDGVDAIKFGLLRLEAVKMGWYSGQREVTIAAAPTGSRRIFMDDLSSINEHVLAARRIALVQPWFAEFVFRTTNHHYLSTGNLAAQYQDKYSKLYQASLIGDDAKYLPASALFHTALHWVSPARAWNSMLACVSTGRVPDAIVLRHKSAPAGTAIIATTEAALSITDPLGLRSKMERIMRIDLSSIPAAVAEIKLNPVRYHRTHVAYGLPPLDAARSKRIEEVIKICQSIAPVTQAIIDVFCVGSDMANAKVLLKHAGQNPFLRKRVTNFLKAAGKEKVPTFEECFAVSQTVEAD